MLTKMLRVKGLAWDIAEQIVSHATLAAKLSLIKLP